jgi:hypothetical protein
MKRNLLMLWVLVFSGLSNSAIYWTVKADGGIMTTSSGISATNIASYIPTGLNPSDSIWESCKNNWVYFNKAADGSFFEEKYIDRMLSTALAAYKTNSLIRVAIERDASNNCYSSQVFDQGT